MTGDAPGDDAVLEAFPGVAIDNDTIEYYRARLTRRLLVPRCPACGSWHMPPMPVCPRCWCPEVVPTEVSGRGTVVLSTTVRIAPPAEGIDYAGGHTLVAVDIEEQTGVRVTAQLLDAGGPLAPGTAVELEWIIRGGVPAPAFRAAGARPS